MPTFTGARSTGARWSTSSPSAHCSERLVALKQVSRQPLQLALQAREEPVLHHLRHAADQSLTEPGDGAAGLDAAADVDDGAQRFGTLRTQGDLHAASDKTGFALAFDG